MNCGNWRYHGRKGSGFFLRSLAGRAGNVARMKYPNRPQIIENVTASTVSGGDAIANDLFVEISQVALPRTECRPQPSNTGNGKTGHWTSGTRFRWSCPPDFLVNTPYFCVRRPFRQPTPAVVGNVMRGWGHSVLEGDACVAPTKIYRPQRAWDAHSAPVSFPWRRSPS